MGSETTLVSRMIIVSVSIEARRFAHWLSGGNFKRDTAKRFEDGVECGAKGFCGSGLLFECSTQDISRFLLH